jgi:hypothetical protein
VNNYIQTFLKIFKDYFKLIQDVLGKGIYIAAWDTKQEHALQPLKIPNKIPSTWESLNIYLVTYVNPKRDGSGIYLNLCLVNFKKYLVPLACFGMELTDQCTDSKH